MKILSQSLKRFLLLLLCASPAMAQTFGPLGTWDQGGTCSPHANKQNATCSRSGTTITCTVTDGTKFAVNEPMIILGTGTALDFAGDLSNSNYGAPLLASKSGNTLTITSLSSGTVAATAGTIEPGHPHWVTMSGAPGPVPNGQKLCFGYENNHWMWVNAMGLATTSDISSATITSKYAGNYCNGVYAIWGELSAWGFNTGGMDSGTFYPTGTFGAPNCSAVPRHPFFEQIFVTGYASSNRNGYASQPATMDADYASQQWVTTCSSVHRGQHDPFSPYYATYVNTHMTSDNAVRYWPRSPFFLYLLGDDFQAQGMLNFGASGDFPTKPRAHNDCDGGLLIAMTSPHQAGTNYNCCQGTPAPPLMYADDKFYAKTLSATDPGCDFTLTTKECSWPDFARNKYTTIAAANTAWSSTYSGFGSSETAVTNEVIGTGDGTTLTFSHNVHANLSNFTVHVFVNGVQVGFDIPVWARNSGGGTAGTGNIKGATMSGGNCVYTTGVCTWTFTAGNAPGTGASITTSYTWGGYPKALVGGTGVEDEDGTSSWVPTQGICLNRTQTWTATTAYSLSNYRVLNDPTSGTWQFLVTAGTSGGSLPAFSTTLGVRTTDGTAVWESLGPPVCGIGGDYTTAPNGNAQYAADIEAWGAHLAAKYLDVMNTALKTPYPDTLYGCIDAFGDYWSPARKEVLQASNYYCDSVQTQGMLDPSQDANSAIKLNFTTQWTQKPIISYTNYYATNSSKPTPSVGYPVYTTQAQRGAGWWNLQNWLTTATGFNGKNPFGGAMWWCAIDCQGTSGGLKTAGLDNAYDGNEDVVASVPCSAPNGTKTCGGESSAATFLGQNGITGTNSITTANALWSKTSVPAPTPVVAPVNPVLLGYSIVPGFNLHITGKYLSGQPVRLDSNLLGSNCTDTSCDLTIPSSMVFLPRPTHSRRRENRGHSAAAIRGME